jgi:hypothetical protein
MELAEHAPFLIFPDKRIVPILSVGAGRGVLGGDIKLPGIRMELNHGGSMFLVGSREILKHICEVMLQHLADDPVVIDVEPVQEDGKDDTSVS